MGDKIRIRRLVVCNFRRGLIGLLGAILVFGLPIVSSEVDASEVRVLAHHPAGVTYNGLHSTENPTPAQVADDLKQIKQHFGVIRTYYAQFGSSAVDVSKVASDVGLKVMVGLYLHPNQPDWVAKDYEQFVKPAVSRGNVISVLIGNEDSDQLDTIKKYLAKARADFPKTPVSTSQTAGFWIDNPGAADLVPMVDFIAVNIYPAWNWERADADLQPIGVTPQAGFKSFRATYDRVAAKYPGKQIVVTETGWPTSYGKIPSKQFPKGVSNARDYLNLVMTWAKTSDPPVNVYLFGMYDPLFGVGLGSPFNYHFGLIDSDGKSKGVLF